MSQWKEMYALQEGVANADADYTIDIMMAFRAKRFDEQVATNPYFFSGPFTGVLVAPAAFTFINRFFSNKTQERPEGVLNKEVLKSFFAITGTDDNPVHTPGWERIPENWYRRNHDDDYTIPGLNFDTLNIIARYREP